MNRLLCALSTMFDPNHQHIATWIQTLVVVIGVIVANLQLSAMVEQNDLPRRTAFHNLTEEYRVNYGQKILAIESAVIRSSFADTSEQEMNDSFAATDAYAILRNYVELLTRIELCGEDRICNRSQTSAFVCGEARRMWFTLNYHVKDIRLASWKSPEIDTVSSALNELMSNECSYLEAVWTRVKADIF